MARDTIVVLMLMWYTRANLALGGSSGSCQGPLDCNGRECLDCSCTNHICICADGWSGDHCQTPFCSDRTSCTNHGNCSQTVHNITCQCDVGYTGPHCETSTCSLVCLHGGAPDPKCTTCEGCLGAWGGPTCEVYNDSVPVEGLLATMQTNFEAVQQQLNSSYNLLCTNGQECPGWGVDNFDGRVANLILTMTPDPINPQKQFHKYVAPKEIDFTPYPNPQVNFDDGAGVFALPSDLVSQVDGIVGQNRGLQGIYNQGWEATLDSYFEGPADQALSVVQGQVALFAMNIPNEFRGQLHHHFVETVQSLPPNYTGTNNQALFNYFFKLYGTSIVVQSTGGGLLEQRSRWNTPLIHTMNKPTLLANAQIDFTASTGVGGHGGVLDPTYAANRVVEVGNSSGGYWCYGGDGSLCARDNITKWQDSLPANPVLLSYTTIPLSEVLALCQHTASDPNLRVTMENAVSGYLAMKKADWAAVDKCPKSGCNGRGSCVPPAEQCTCAIPPPKGSQCTMSPIIGRMCSAVIGTEGITGGTRMMLFEFAAIGSKSVPFPCINGNISFTPDVHTWVPMTCETDVEGRVRSVWGFNGSWSTNAAQGSTSSATIAGRTCTCKMV